MEFISQLLAHPSLLAHFSGASNYTWVQFQNGERRLLSKPLSYFEERLPTFIRIHKTALINPVWVAGVEHPLRAKMPGIVRMQDGTELPVSRRRWSEIWGLLQITTGKVSPIETPPSGSTAPLRITPPVLHASVPLVVLAVMTGDALRLTREHVDGLGLGYRLEHLEQGAGFATALLLGSIRQRPDLLLLDARTDRADRILTLRAFKSDARLRAIPVVWLAAPGEDTAQAYALDANSVVAVSDEPASFTRTIGQLCRYWLMVVQLPPEARADRLD